MNNYVLTVEEMAEELHICKKQAYSLCRISGFPCFKIGKTIRIDAEGLREWVRKQSMNGGE